MTGSSTPTLERTIYDTMLHSQVPNDEVREHWARFTSAVAASVIETFKANPRLLADCMTDSASYAGNIKSP